ncbi:clan AA aspartic protease [Candidatus Woesearchaeota archaeon]|nr:clan AA aspartic protease [Candidatus Woesearchaeota archaeon]
MGHSWVDAEISDLERKHSEKVKALVDTGATLTVLPKALADKIGIKALAEREVESGGIIKLKEGEARIIIKGKEDVTRVLISDIIDKVLIGVVVLESLGFSVDPKTGTLKETPLLLYFTK